jgi:hypothetical protein
MRPERDVQWPWLGHRAEIIGGTFDLEGHIGKHQNWSLSHFRALGDVTLRSVQMRGQRGSRGLRDGQPLKESFALTQESGGVANVNWCEVKKPDVRDSADAYVSGLYVCDGIVANNDVNLTEHGWFAYSCWGHASFKDNYGKAQWFWYTDTNFAYADLRANRGDLAYGAVGVRSATGRRQITGCNNHFNAPRLVEWAYGAEDGFVVLENTKGKWEYDACVGSDKGMIILKGGFNKPVNVHKVSPSHFDPVFIS